MRRAIIRSITVGLLAVIVGAFPAAWLAFADQPPSTESSAEPLPARDREFLVVIRFANLWEIPMGRLATERGTTQTTKDVGATLAEDHTKLNVDVKKLADQYGVTLPDQPTSQQQAWMDEISSTSGEAFDRTFADRLRAAHGTVFGLVAEVRAGTGNDAIRTFAQQAIDVVMKHMTLLEGTGHLKSSGHFAQASARTMENAENSLSRSDIVLAAVLGIVVLVGTLGFVRMVSSHGTTAR